jgi:hypothetical protein
MPNAYSVLPIVNSDRTIVIDTSLYSVLSRYRWYIPKSQYAGNPRPFTTVRKDGKVRQLRLARAITKAPQGLYPKHLDGNFLDCRRANLKLVTWRDDAGGCQEATSFVDELSGGSWRSGII